MPLLGLFLQHKDGTNLILHTKSRWTVSTAVQATRDFASQVAQLRKEDFGPLGLRNSEPHFAAGRITSLSFYQIAYELLSDVYLAVVQHIDDNPFYSDTTLQRAKSTLITLCRDKLGYEEMQKRHIEIWSALEKVLDGARNDASDDWTMLDKKNVESRDVLDTLFAVDFEIPAEVLPDARPQHFGQVFGDTANTPTPKQTRRAAASVSTKKSGSNIKTSSDAVGKDSSKRKLRAATTTSSAITTAFSALEKSGEKDKKSSKSTTSKGARAGSMSPSKSRAGKGEIKVENSSTGADSGSDGGLTPSTKKSLRLVMPTANPTSSSTPSTPPSSGSHKRSHTMGSISTSADALTSPRSLESSTDHSVDSGGGLASLETPTISSGVASSGAFGTPGSQVTPRTSDDSETASSMPNTPRSGFTMTDEVSTPGATPISSAKTTSETHMLSPASAKFLAGSDDGVETPHAHPTIITTSASTTNSSATNANNKDAVEADSAHSRPRKNSSTFKMIVPTPRMEADPDDDPTAADYLDHLIISSESEPEEEDLGGLDDLGPSPRLESPSDTEEELEMELDEEDTDDDDFPLPYGTSNAGSLIEGGSLLDGGFLTAPTATMKKRNELKPEDRRFSTGIDSDLATTPRDDDPLASSSTAAAAPSSAASSLKLAGLLSVPTSFVEPEIIITPRSDSSQESE